MAGMPGNARVLAGYSHRSRDHAQRALGHAGDADVAPMQDQPMMRMQQEFVGRELQQALLDFERIAARGEARAVRDAKDMRVDGDGALAECDVEDDVGRLASDARQLLQRVAIAWHLAAILVDQDLRQRHDVLRLVIEQADRADVGNQAIDTEPGDRSRRVRDLEQPRGRLVDALVGRLR